MSPLKEPESSIKLLLAMGVWPLQPLQSVHAHVHSTILSKAGCCLCMNYYFMSMYCSVYTYTANFNFCWRQQKCAACAQHIQGHCMLALIQPSESVQISGLEALQSEEGWIFIMSHSKFWIVSSIRLQGGKRTQMKVSIWGQLEFLYDFRVAVFTPRLCV